MTFNAISMIPLLRRFFLMACIVLPLRAAAQDINARSPQPQPVSKQQRAAEKKKAKQRQKSDKAIEKGKKQHMKLQSKQTKKMMKKSKRKSKRWNEHRREFFLKRWFAPRHRKAALPAPDAPFRTCAEVDHDTAFYV
jgi:hypothetical protein